MVPGIGPVDRDEIVKGYEISRGKYVLIEDEEIEAVKIDSRGTHEPVQFVDAADIDPLYFAKPYYVVPQDDLAEQAFIVLRDALRKAKKIGPGQMATRSWLRSNPATRACFSRRCAVVCTAGSATSVTGKFMRTSNRAIQTVRPRCPPKDQY